MLQNFGFDEVLIVDLDGNDGERVYVSSTTINVDEKEKFMCERACSTCLPLLLPRTPVYFDIKNGLSGGCVISGGIASK